jgi:hypothetical protein
MQHLPLTIVQAEEVVDLIAVVLLQVQDPQEAGTDNWSSIYLLKNKQAL